MLPATFCTNHHLVVFFWSCLLLFTLSSPRSPLLGDEHTAYTGGTILHASALSFRSRQSRASIQGQTGNSRIRNQALRTGNLLHQRIQTTTSEYEPPDLTSVNAVDVYNPEDESHNIDEDSGGWNVKPSKGSSQKMQSRLDFDPWANEESSEEIASDAITDFSSRMWSDDPDPVVSTVRADIIRNRNGPAALWVAVREDDRVKAKSLMESGVDMTKGFIHEVTAGNTTVINQQNLEKLRNALNLQLEKEKAKADRLQEDAQRQFESGGFSQYNEADVAAKAAARRVKDIETIIKDTEDLLREGSSSSVDTITIGPSNTATVHVKSPLTVAVDDFVIIHGVHLFESAESSKSSKHSEGLLVVKIESSTQFCISIPSSLLVKHHLPEAGTVVAESGTITVMPSLTAKRNFIAAAASKADGRQSKPITPLKQAQEEGSWDVFGFLRNMYSAGGASQVAGKGGSGGVPWSEYVSRSTTVDTSAAASASTQSANSASASASGSASASADTTVSDSGSGKAGIETVARDSSVSNDPSMKVSSTLVAKNKKAKNGFGDPDDGKGFAGGRDDKKQNDDNKCCSCTPDKIDARWPGVKGSPILNDMNKNEYNWGKVGEKDPANPVGRKNQPKPCCGCDKDDLGQRFKQVQSLSRNGENIVKSSEMVSPVDFMEPLAVPRQNTVHQGLQYVTNGIASHHDGVTRDRKIGIVPKGSAISWHYQESLSPPLVPFAPEGRLEGSHIDAFNVNGDISSEYANEIKSEFRKHLKALKQAGAGKNSDHPSGNGLSVVDLAHTSAGLLFASRSKWQHLFKGQNLSLPNLTNSIDGPAVVACKILGPSRCKEQLSEAVQAKDVGVEKAISVLRKARAGSLCDQAGPWQCHETLSEAQARGHRGVVAAISALKRGAADYLRGVAEDRNNDARRARKFLDDLLLRSPNSTSAIKAATRIAVAAETKFSRAKLALQGILEVEDGSKKHAVLHFQHTNGIHRCSALDRTATADCFCRMLGSQRCAMTLFQAYMRRTPDAIYAIRALLGGDSPGPASIFCIALGRKRCREAMAAATMLCHHDVVDAFNILQHTVSKPVELRRAWHNCSVYRSDRSGNLFRNENGKIIKLSAKCPANPMSNVTCSGRGRCVVDRIRGAFCDCNIPTALGWHGNACELWQGTDGPGCLAYREGDISHRSIPPSSMQIGSRSKKPLTTNGEYWQWREGRCSGHGDCIMKGERAGACNCQNGWKGPRCAKSTLVMGNNPEIGSCCPSLTDEPCSGHGKCNSQSCKCVCNPKELWAGLDCAIPLGQNCLRCDGGLCGGHGLCSFLDVCVDTLSPAMTSKPGLNGGPSCDSGWTGYCCNIKILSGCLAVSNISSERCSGHGSCGRDGICYENASHLSQPGCEDGWSGSDCSCLNSFLPCIDKGCPSRNKKHCSGHGKCYRNGHGDALGKGVCSCDHGWEGKDCFLPSPNICPVVGVEGIVCNGHGECSTCDGECVCDNGWFGTACEVPPGNGTTCPSCVNPKTLMPGLCAGSDNGECGMDGHCACRKGWGGECCDQEIGSCGTCPTGNLLGSHLGFGESLQVCSGHGHCDTHNCPVLCKCEEGWKGQACQVSESCDGSCPLGRITGTLCSGHGKCLQRGRTCLCDKFYNGDDCGEPIKYLAADTKCPTVGDEVCNGHGKCVGHGPVGGTVCDCSYGWTGEYCDVINDNEDRTFPGCTAISGTPPCNGHGACPKQTVTHSPDGSLFVNTAWCTCLLGWYGINCDSPIKHLDSSGCPAFGGQTCSGRGACNTGKRCVCHNGYSGEVCDKNSEECPITLKGLTCNGRGRCHKDRPNVCVCNNGYSGYACGFDISGCPLLPGSGEQCSGHGWCVGGSSECTCIKGWTAAADCSTPSFEDSENHNPGFCLPDLLLSRKQDCLRKGICTEAGRDAQASKSVCESFFDSTGNPARWQSDNTWFPYQDGQEALLGEIFRNDVSRFKLLVAYNAKLSKPYDVNLCFPKKYRKTQLKDQKNFKHMLFFTEIDESAKGETEIEKLKLEMRKTLIPQIESCKSKAKRPLDFAEENPRAKSQIIDSLVGQGAERGKIEKSYPFVMSSLVNAHDICTEQDRRSKHINHGRHGFPVFQPTVSRGEPGNPIPVACMDNPQPPGTQAPGPDPMGDFIPEVMISTSFKEYEGKTPGPDGRSPNWWSCKPGEDGKGCMPVHGVYASDIECDPSTGEFCECGAPEPPNSDMACVKGMSVNLPSMKLVRVKKGMLRPGFDGPSTRLKNQRNYKGFGKGQASLKSASDCDWNPFTNLLYFLFCIILKILKPIITAPFLLELPSEASDASHAIASSTPRPPEHIMVQVSHPALSQPAAAIISHPEQMDGFFVIDNSKDKTPIHDLDKGFTSTHLERMLLSRRRALLSNEEPLKAWQCRFVEDQMDCEHEQECEWLHEDNVCGRRTKHAFNPEQGNGERPPPEDPSLPPFDSSKVPLNKDNNPNDKMGMPNSKRKKAMKNYKKCGRSDCKKCKKCGDPPWPEDPVEEEPENSSPPHSMKGPADSSVPYGPYRPYLRKGREIDWNEEKKKIDYAGVAPALAGHTSNVVNNGLGVVVFGGFNIDKKIGEYDGDIEYQNGLWWLRVSLDLETKRLKGNGILWLGPLKDKGLHVDGVAPSPRAYHTMTEVMLGPNEEKALLLFGGYDGSGDTGFKNDMHVLKHYRQTPEEIEKIKEEQRESKMVVAQEALAPEVIGNPITRPWKWRYRVWLRDHMLRTNCNVGQAPCQPSFDPEHPLPWQADRTYRSWNYFVGSLAPYWGTGKPWNRRPEWSSLSPSGTGPSPRHQHAAAAIGNYLLIFGGLAQPEGFLGDIHVLDTVKLSWYNVGRYRNFNDQGELCEDEKSPSLVCNAGGLKRFWNDPSIIKGNFPSPRAGHTMSSWGKKLIIYGGYTKELGVLDDMHVLDSTTCSFGEMGNSNYDEIACEDQKVGFIWRSALVKGSPPTPRFGHSASPVYPDSPMLFFLGGYGAGEPGTKGNWRKRLDQQGYRNEALLINLGLPNVTGIRVPQYGKPSFPTTPARPTISEVPGVKNFDMKMMNPISPEFPKVSWPYGTAPASGRMWKPLYRKINISVEGNFFGDRKTGSQAIGVLIGNARNGPFPCAPVTVLSQRKLTCTLSPGIGRDLDVMVFAANQATVSGNKLFSYEPPRIVSVIPPFLVDFCAPKGSRDCLPRGPFLVYGTNFGHSPEAIEDLTLGGAKCLEVRYISQFAVLCICVGESKRDIENHALQGGAQIKIGGQYSNKAPFLILSPPPLLEKLPPGVWFPVTCPSPAVIREAGYVYRFREEFPAAENEFSKYKDMSIALAKAIRTQDPKFIEPAEEAFLLQRDIIHRVAIEQQEVQLGAAFRSAESQNKQVEKDSEALLRIMKEQEELRNSTKPSIERALFLISGPGIDVSPVVNNVTNASSINCSGLSHIDVTAHRNAGRKCDCTGLPSNDSLFRLWNCTLPSLINCSVFTMNRPESNVPLKVCKDSSCYSSINEVIADGRACNCSGLLKNSSMYSKFSCESQQVVRNIPGTVPSFSANGSVIYNLLPPVTCMNRSDAEVNAVLSDGLRCKECSSTKMASNSIAFIKYGCIPHKISCENLTQSEIEDEINGGRACDCTYIQFNDTRRDSWHCRNRTTPSLSIVVDENVANSTSKSTKTREEIVDLANKFTLPDDLKMKLQMALGNLNNTLDQEIILPENLTGTTRKSNGTLGELNSVIAECELNLKQQAKGTAGAEMTASDGSASSENTTEIHINSFIDSGAKSLKKKESSRVDNVYNNIVVSAAQTLEGSASADDKPAQFASRVLEMAKVGPPLPILKAHSSESEVYEKQLHILSTLRKQQGLDKTIPRHCQMIAKPMDANDNTSISRSYASMRYSKVSATPECNCTHFLRSVRHHGMPMNGRLPKSCKAAISHFAWRKGCEELLQLHKSTCFAAFSEKAASVRESRQPLWNLYEKHRRQTYRLPSVRAQCDGLWQAILLRCTEEEETSRLLKKYKWEQVSSGTPSTWFPRSPLTSRPPKLRFSFDEQQRFREKNVLLPASLGGSFSVSGSNFLRFMKVDAAARKAGLLKSPFYTTGSDNGVDDLGHEGPGNGALEPLWILPSMKLEPREPPENLKSKKKVDGKFEGIYLAWIRPDKICLPGKPPQPRRAMTLVGPLADKVTYVAHGGIGLTGRPDGGNADAPDDKKTAYADKTVTGNLRQDEHVFSDTFLLVDISKATRTIKRGFGIGEHQCFSGEEPMPARAPDVKPNDFRNP